MLRAEQDSLTNLKMLFLSVTEVSVADNTNFYYQSMKTTSIYFVVSLIKKRKFMVYTEVLKNNKDFLTLYKKGRSIVSRTVVIYFRKNGLPYNRFGITAGKKVGNAVMRNRAKRIIRQAYRENEILFPLGIDIVFVARRHAAEIKEDFLSSYIREHALEQIEAQLASLEETKK